MTLLRRIPRKEVGTCGFTTEDEGSLKQAAESFSAFIAMMERHDEDEWERHEARALDQVVQALLKPTGDFLTSTARIICKAYEARMVGIYLKDKDEDCLVLQNLSIKPTASWRWGLVIMLDETVLS